MALQCIALEYSGYNALKTGEYTSVHQVTDMEYATILIIQDGVKK